MERYIKITGDNIDAKTAMLWVNTVYSVLPEGVVLPVSVGGIEMPYTRHDNCIACSLSRDLNKSELSSVHAIWASKGLSDSYTIETNPSQADALQGALMGISIDGDEYKDLKYQIAKKNHDLWVQDKLKDGWRYGLNIDIVEKTHPMLRSWDDLPEQFRIIEGGKEDILLSVLEKQGYAVIKKEQLQLFADMFKTIIS